MPDSKSLNPIARDPNTIELTPTQVDNYLVRPENFKVRKYNDPIPEPFHGQGRNDADAERISNEKFNRGSLRAQGNVNKTDAPSYQQAVDR